MAPETYNFRIDNNGRHGLVRIPRAKTILGRCLTAPLAAALLFGGISAREALAAPVNALQVGRVCHLPGYDQSLRCTEINVPLDYHHPDGAKMALHITLAPALREGARPDPVFVLAGGPGQAGSDILGLLESSLRKLRATSFSSTSAAPACRASSIATTRAKSTISMKPAKSSSSPSACNR